MPRPLLPLATLLLAILLPACAAHRVGHAPTYKQLDAPWIGPGERAKVYGTEQFDLVKGTHRGFHYAAGRRHVSFDQLSRKADRYFHEWWTDEQTEGRYYPGNVTVVAIDPPIALLQVPPEWARRNFRVTTSDIHDPDIRWLNLDSRRPPAKPDKLPDGRLAVPVPWGRLVIDTTTGQVTAEPHQN